MLFNDGIRARIRSGSYCTNSTQRSPGQSATFPGRCLDAGAARNATTTKSLPFLQHDDSDLAAALNHPEDRRLFLREGAPTGCTLEPPTTWSASLELIGPALVASHDRHLVAFHHAAHPHGRTALDDRYPAQLLRHRLAVAFSQVQLLGNLPIRQVQTHRVPVGQPNR